MPRQVFCPGLVSRISKNPGDQPPQIERPRQHRGRSWWCPDGQSPGMLSGTRLRRRASCRHARPVANPTMVRWGPSQHLPDSCRPSPEPTRGHSRAYRKGPRRWEQSWLPAKACLDTLLAGSSPKDDLHANSPGPRTGSHRYEMVLSFQPLPHIPTQPRWASDRRPRPAC